MFSLSMNTVTLLYLVASVCFIQALKGLSHPTTSIRGNVFGMTGMAIAVVTTLGVIRYRPVTREPFLASVHPGVTPDGVQAETGFPLDLTEVTETPAPSAEELEILRRVVGPERVFLRKES